MTKLDELKFELGKRSLNYVGFRGAVGGPICVVGEAPGADEDSAGLPFVGAAGRELDRMLAEALVDAPHCWWTNVYQTRPPDNKLDRIGEFGLARDLYLDAFREQLCAYKPTFIAAAGATALGVLCPFTVPSRKNARAEIGKWQGSLLRSPLLEWPHYVVPFLHPAAILREWSDRAIAVLCLAKLQEEFAWWKRVGALRPLPYRELIAEPSVYDAIDFLRALIAHAELVAVDIENIGIFKGKYKTPQRGRVPYVIGFSADPGLAMSIGLAEYERAKARELWRLINVLLRTKRQVYQSGTTHDIPWLRFIGFEPNLALCDDTLVRHHTLWPELPHKLEFQTVQYCRQPYYKNEGHIESARDRPKLKRYNCLDVCITLEVFGGQQEEFDQRCSTH